MSDRNEALRLADALEQGETYDAGPHVVYGWVKNDPTSDAADALRRLTAEQAVMRQWIAEALPVLASIDDCEDMEPLRALIESGRKLVEGGPDDLLAGVE